MVDTRWNERLKQTAKGMAIAGGAVTAVGAAAAGLAAWAGYAAWRRHGQFDLAGKTTLITGGSRGLGYAVAREFLRQGSRVAICARDPLEVKRAVAKLEGMGPVFSVVQDLTQPGAAEAAIAAVRQHWGPVEVLVHDAGVMHVGPWEQATEEEFRYAMELHCWAALRLARLVLPEMIARRQGRIVNISSIGGLVPVPHMLPYVTSKFALTGLSQGLATEVRRHGVRVTCVCPFLVRTGSQEGVTVKGHHEREFAWFAFAGSMPGLAEEAGLAARSIVRACRQGQAEVVLWLPAKLAALAHGVAPSAVTAVMGMAAGLLPEAVAGGTAPRRGAESYNRWGRRLIRPLVQSAGAGLNQA